MLPLSSWILHHFKDLFFHLVVTSPAVLYQCSEIFLPKTQTFLEHHTWTKTDPPKLGNSISSIGLGKHLQEFVELFLRRQKSGAGGMSSCR